MIAQSITDQYRAEGYFLSRTIVPPQDGAGLARIVVIEGRIGETSLASAGAGVRLTFDDRIIAGFELARPLTHTPYDEGDKDWRQYFSLTASY